MDNIIAVILIINITLLALLPRQLVSHAVLRAFLDGGLFAMLQYLWALLRFALQIPLGGNYLRWRLSTGMMLVVVTFGALKKG